MYFLVLSFLLLGVASANAQVTIGTTDDPKATLDVKAVKTDASTAEGIIAPRLTGDQIAVKGLKYDAELNGAIVYATEGITVATTEGLAPVLSRKVENITAAGYYYYSQPAGTEDKDGRWQALGGGGAAPAPAFVVSAEITATTYTVTDESYLRVKPTSLPVAITLPTDAPVGKVIYISNVGTQDAQFPAATFYNASFAAVNAGDSKVLVHIGDNLWDFVSGW